MDKKEYKKPELIEEVVEFDDIVMASTNNTKQSVFKPDAGIWDIFRW